MENTPLIDYFQGYDSDVAHEKNMDYTSKTYANPIRLNTGVKPMDQDYEEEEK